MKKRDALVSIMFIVLVSLQGCSRHIRPYEDQSQTLFASASLPNTSDIIDQSNDERSDIYVNQDFVRVWKACIQIASQAYGILRMETDNNQSGRILFITSEPTYSNPLRIISSTHRETLEVWLTVNIKKIGENKTRLTTAWISPETMTAIPLIDLEGSNDEARRLLLSAAIKSSDKFISAVQAQLNHGKLSENFASPLPTIRPSQSPSLKRPTPYNERKYDAEYGNYLAAKHLAGNYIITAPKLEDTIQEIVKRIFSVSDSDTISTTIYLYADDTASPPFSLPNGEIFIGTGFLQQLENTDQLAAIIAHEIDHIIFQDQIKRLHREVKHNTVTFATASITSFTSLIALMVHHSDDWLDEEGSANVRFQDMAIIIATMIGVMASGLLETEYNLTQYSVDQELRADHNASIYLWRAGYNHHALKDVLQLSR